jgi:hypothetical protein
MLQCCDVGCISCFMVFEAASIGADAREAVLPFPGNPL